MNKMKAFLYGAMATLPALSFAADPNATAFETALGDVTDGITDSIEKVVAKVAIVVVAAVALWAIPFAWRKLRGSAGK